MKKNLKGIAIKDNNESNNENSKQIIQATIINSPKIISSENHVIIKQYINTKEPEKITDKKLLSKNITKNDNVGEDSFNGNTKLIYYKQGSNYNKKAPGYMLNNTINTIYKRSKNYFKNNISKTNKTNIRIKEKEKEKEKESIETYNYLNKNKKNDKSKNKDLKFIKINSPSLSSINQEIKTDNKVDKNIDDEEKNLSVSQEKIILEKPIFRNNDKIHEIAKDNEKSKTLEGMMNRKFKKKISNNKFDKDSSYKLKNELSNETNNNNASGVNLYVKKSPFQRQILRNAIENREIYTIKPSYLSKSNIMNKNKENKSISKLNRHILQKNNIIDAVKNDVNNQTCKKIILLEKKKKSSSTFPEFIQNRHNDPGENLSSPYLDKEKESANNSKNNLSYSVATIQTLKKNNSLPITSFRFLLNKASKDKQFGDSFRQAYEKNKNTSLGKSIDKIRRKTNEKYENDSRNATINENLDENLNSAYKNKSTEKIKIKLNNFKKISKEKSKKETLKMNNLEVLKNDNIDDNMDTIHVMKFNKKSQINKKMNDRNILAKSLNNFKPVFKTTNRNLFLVVNKSNDNIINNSKIKKKSDLDSIIQNEITNENALSPSIKLRKKITFSPSIFIDIELIYNLESKIFILFQKIQNYQRFEEECLDLIKLYFKNDISKYIIQLFNGDYYKNMIINYIKIELLTYFLCYDLCYNINFDKIIILLKQLINLVHQNFLILMIYIINGYNNNIFAFYNENKNKTVLANLENIINQNLEMDIRDDEINEEKIITLIMQNAEEIKKYYKLIVESVYQNEYIYSNDINFKFPYCLKTLNNLSENKKLEVFNSKNSIIIPSFFIESYQLLNNYSIIDLENFFYSFLDKMTIKVKRNNKFILPKINSNKYKYTLVLDLDETLVHCQRKANKGFILLLRPGLIEFLEKMKNMCELILFSFGTSNYVDSIINVIEKEEKYFEYILDRNHGMYENGMCVKDLNMLNRDLKSIIIIDDTSKYFQLHQENGICVKPFYGDVENDKNTLIILGNILEKIFYDANVTGDVRISLKKFKKLLEFSNIINYN